MSGWPVAIPTGRGIGLTDFLPIGLAPAFLIRRFAPPCPFAVPCGRLAAEAAALPTDRCTRLCSASSATGSAEQRSPGGRLFRCGCGTADARWGATRPPPVEGGGRGASGSGRRETMVRQHQGYSPGTATGRPYGVRGIVGGAGVEGDGRRGQDRSPTRCGSQDRTTPQSAALTAPL